LNKTVSLLLLIAVMFTFSFGSAFAAIDYSAAQFTYNQAVAELENVAEDAIAELAKTTYGGTANKYSEKAEKEAIAEFNAKATAAIKKELDEQLTALYEDSKTDEDGKYTIATAVSAIQNAVVGVSIEWDVIASKAEIELLKAEVKADIAAIDLSVYSKEVAAGETKSPYEKAQAIVDQALTLVDKQVAVDDADDNAYVITRLPQVYAAAVGVADPTGYLYWGGTILGETFEYGLDDLPTVASETVDAAKADYAKAYVMKEMKDAIAARKAAFVEPLQAYNFAVALKTTPTKVELEQVEENKEAIAKADADFAKIEEVVVYLVNAATKLGELGTVDANGAVSAAGFWAYAHLNTPAYTDDSVGVTFTDNGTLYKYDVAMVTELIERADLVADAKDNADLLKATIAIDGSTAVAIDAALEAAIDDIYKGIKTDATITGYNAYEQLYHHIEDTLIGGGLQGVKINTVKYDAIDKWDDTLAADYDAAKHAEVKAIVKAAKAAVRAADSVAAANEAFLAAYAEYDAVITKAEHNKDFNTVAGTNYKAYQAAKKELQAYADAKTEYTNKMEAGLASSAYADYADAADNVAAKYIGELYTKCFTADDIAAKLEEGKAAIDAIKTEKVLKEEAAAINAQVAALPTTATVADKDAVFAAYDAVLAHNEYCALVESAQSVSYAKVERLANIIKKAEYDAIDDAIEVINKDGVAKLDEAAAVDAVRAAWDAYYAFYEAATSDYTALTDYTDLENTVLDLEAEISAAEIEAVKVMIAKLPANGEDAAAVVAARDAFDALSRGQQHTIRHNASAYYDKLVDAEKIVAAELVGNVEGLKITASSSAKKGSITVKWDVKGSTVGVEAYEIWKSTKKNSGFKKAFTTEKMSYKNTKGLKKGTRYYYKVRAIAFVEGEKITSDWSNKAYRIAK